MGHLSQVYLVMLPRQYSNTRPLVVISLSFANAEPAEDIVQHLLCNLLPTHFTKC